MLPMDAQALADLPVADIGIGDGQQQQVPLRALEFAEAGVDRLAALVTGTSLHLLAEQFGCADTVRALVHRHRADRARYRRALRIVDQHHSPALNPSDGYRWPPPEPPPEEEETLLELLERELGAHSIPVGA